MFNTEDEQQKSSVKIFSPKKGQQLPHKVQIKVVPTYTWSDILPRRDRWQRPTQRLQRGNDGAEGREALAQVCSSVPHAPVDKSTKNSQWCEAQGGFFAAFGGGGVARFSFMQSQI